MKTILTNPSFVPIEEVMIREEEIARLKDGWVKMEDRWKDAVMLIDSWRKRMAASGRPVDEEEMIMSLRLSPAKARHDAEAQHYAEFGLSAVAEENEEESIMQREASPAPSNPESLHLVPAVEAYNDHLEDAVDSSAEMSAAEDNMLEDYDVEEPNFEVLQESVTQPGLNDSIESSPLPEPPQLSPLRNSNTAGNRGLVQNWKLRKRTEFQTIDEGKARDVAEPVELSKPASACHKFAPSRHSAEATGPEEKHRTVSASSLDEVLLAKPCTDADTAAVQSKEHADLKHTPRRGPSRLPLPRNAEPQQSPLTMANIAAKLAASEKEADAARVRAKLRAARAARATQKPTLEAPEAKQQQQQVSGDEKKQADADPVKRDTTAVSDHRVAVKEGEGQQARPEKRKREPRQSKVASRRRSTLSPLELQSLISGTAQ
jgi:hypothetical protein